MTRIEEIKARCGIATNAANDSVYRHCHHSVYMAVSESVADIPWLLAEVERLTRERDAAVEDIQAMFGIDMATEICRFCKHNGKCSHDKSCDEQAEWRGPEED